MQILAASLKRERGYTLWSLACSKRFASSRGRRQAKQLIPETLRDFHQCLEQLAGTHSLLKVHYDPGKSVLATVADTPTFCELRALRPQSLVLHLPAVGWRPFAVHNDGPEGALRWLDGAGQTLAACAAWAVQQQFGAVVPFAEAYAGCEVQGLDFDVGCNDQVFRDTVAALKEKVVTLAAEGQPFEGVQDLPGIGVEFFVQGLGPYRLQAARPTQLILDSPVSGLSVFTMADSLRIRYWRREKWTRPADQISREVEKALGVAVELPDHFW
eukprot:EG_transcript_21365